MSSAVCGSYQKVNAVVPEAGTATVWTSELSPAGAEPDSRPSRADAVPVCGLAVDTVGIAVVPLAVHGARPLSNPPLMMSDELPDGAVSYTHLTLPTIYSV